MNYLKGLMAALCVASVMLADGQTVYRLKGVVTDSTGAPLAGASIRAYRKADTLGMVSGADGSFLVRDAGGPYLRVRISLVGYQPVDKRLSAWSGPQAHVDTIRMLRSVRSLDTVIVTSVAPVVLKGDTVEYRARAFSIREDDLLDDLMTKLPGITKNANGDYMAMGQKITKITLNGKDFFGDDMAVALQNLPANIIKNLQVVKDYGEESKITGIKSGQPAIVLNVNTKDDKKDGLLGRTSAGAGTNGSYLANGFFNKFHDDFHMALVGSANDVNTTAGGNNSRQSVGVQYGDRWTPVLAGNGHYDFSHQGSNQIANSIQTTTFPGAVTVNTSNSTTRNSGSTHGLNYEVDIDPDKRNIIKLFAHGNYADNHSGSVNNFSIDQTDSLNHKITNGYTSSTSSSTAPGYSTNALYVHRFKRVGELLSMNGSINYSTGKQQSEVISKTSITVGSGAPVYTPLDQQVSGSNTNTTVSARLTYYLPLGKTVRFQMNYSYTGMSTHTLRSTYNIDSATRSKTFIDSLSDVYNYNQTTHLAGLGLNGDGKKLSYNLSVGLQPVVMSGSSTQQHYSNNYSAMTVLPQANLNYKIRTSLNLSMNYSSSSSLPDLRQLRPLTDYTNPQYPVTGNPDLKPSTTHNMNLSLNQVNTKSGSFISLNLSGTEVQNSIVTNTINNTLVDTGTAATVVQETRYLNTNGVYSGNASYSYSRPYLHNRLTFNLNGGVSYGNNVAYANSIRTINANWNWNQSLQVQWSVPDKSELSLNINYSSNKTVYTPASAPTTTVNTLGLSLNGKYTFSRRLVFNCNGSYAANYGFSSAFNNNPVMINPSVEELFLKKRTLSIKLQCNNLLNQRMPVVRSIVGNTITDNQAVGIGRYFLLSLNFRFNKFSGGSAKK